MNRLLKSDLYRTVVLTLLAGVAAVTVALANRDVYSKQEIDSRIDSVCEREDVRHKRLDRELEYMHDDVKWLVRKLGGVPSAEAEEDHHSP